MPSIFSGVVLDISLFLGALGVVLTIIFFVIGYRQTIGARRERSRAANQNLVDTLFRRLALEESFTLNRLDVAKVSSGWAIAARVRSTDIHSLQELEDLLSARALESDYIAESQRKAISHRISSMFEEQRTPVYVENSSDRSLVRPEVFLAVGSGLASLVAAVSATTFFQDTQTETARNIFESAILPVFGLIVLTAGALLFYTRVRDLSRGTTHEPLSAQAREINLERAFFQAARRQVKSFRSSADPAYDFVFESEGKVIGVELKSDVNKITRSLLSRTVARMKAAVQSGKISRVIVVSASEPNARVMALSEDDVSFIHLPDFFSLLPDSSTPHEIARSEPQ
ncbi:hypothetical protein QP179_01540 [Sphingomonas aurantiaca]|uniref:hypothetical protein n=1 Tax=Sphingomonas aurantiaca TaxID=185949 RepID=UPI002FDFC3ED